MKTKRYYIKHKKYKKYHKRKGTLKPLGIFALTRSEITKSLEKKPKKKIKINLKHASLNSIIMLEFIMTCELEFGTEIVEKEKNQSLINNYGMAIRQRNVLYNLHLLVSRLRDVFKNITSRLLYKKHCLINYNPRDQQINSQFIRKPLETFLRRDFVITWKKWLGGVLTNFKRISKRLISRRNNKAYDKNMKDFTITYTKNLPKLPSYVINTWDCHWALNESRALRIKNVQMIENTYCGLTGDINLAINTSYYAVCTFTILLQECYSSVRKSKKFIHRGKLIRRVKRKVKKLKLPRFFRRFSEGLKTRKKSYV